MRININCESGRLAIAASLDLEANEKDLSGRIAEESAPSLLAIIDAKSSVIGHALLSRY